MPLSRRDLRVIGMDQFMTAAFIEPGDMMMGRVVHATETEVPFVKITFDDGSHVHAHVYDEIDVDSRAQRWCRLEPTFGEDGERSGWRLVLLMDGASGSPRVDAARWAGQRGTTTRRRQMIGRRPATSRPPGMLP